MVVCTVSHIRIKNLLESPNRIWSCSISDYYAAKMALKERGRRHAVRITAPNLSELEHQRY